MVQADQNAVRFDLGAEVPVADMPGQSQQAGRILGPNLQQRLSLRPHLQNTPILQAQARTAHQEDGVGQVEQSPDAMIAGQGDPPSMAIVIAQRDVISRRSAPGAGFQDIYDS